MDKEKKELICLHDYRTIHSQSPFFGKCFDLNQCTKCKVLKKVVIDSGVQWDP